MRRAFRLTIELVSSLIQRENIEVVVRPRRYGAEIEARWTPQRRR